jgi:hypothetical protein
MLNKLFRPKWEHANPEIRKTAIQKLGSTDIALLEKIALSDNHHDIRLQAISQIDDLSALERLINNSQEQEFALKCWVSVLINSDKYNALAIEQRILDCNNEKLLCGIIAYSDNASLRNLALSGIKEEGALLSLMQNTKTGRVWQAAIEKLSTEDAIKKAIHIVSGRDKKSQQLIKSKLDIIKAEQQAILTQEENFQHLSDKLTHLERTDTNPLFEGILLAAKQQWAEIKDLYNNEQINLINTLITNCDEKLLNKNDAKLEIATQNHQSVISEEAFDQLQQKTTDLTTTLSNDLIYNDNTATTIANINAEWESIKNQINPQHSATYRRVLSTLNSLFNAHQFLSNNTLSQQLSAGDINNIPQHALKQYKKELEKISSSVKSDTLVAKKINAFSAMIAQQQKNITIDINNAQANIKKLLHDTDNALLDKNLKSAQKSFSSARKLLKDIPEHLSKEHQNNVQRMFQAIRALEDWKNFANDEKRQELCAKMQQFINADIEPQFLSEQIKTLQNQWKALGHCHNQELWNTFKAYSDEAYLPCQIYFNKQKELRQFNALQRTTICEQIETFINNHDWNSTDWKALENLYKATHNEWKKYSPVEREDHQKLQDRFFNSSNIIKEKLNHERKSNHEKMAAIIVQAEKLLAEDDIQKAIDEYQLLHKNWQKIGIHIYKQQQKQWLTFKKVGDGIYEKRQNAYHAADNERKENLQQANSIIKDINALSQLSNEDFQQSQHTFQALKENFKNISSLPQDSYKACQSAFINACDAVERKITNVKQQQWHKHFINLMTAANEWKALEAQGGHACINTLPKEIPEKWLQILQARFENNIPKEPLKLAKILCLEIESLAGIQTPKEDAELKMQWQIESLAKNFGQLKKEPDENVAEIIFLRWFAQSCWNEDEHHQLEKRFLTAAKQVIGY